MSVESNNIWPDVDLSDSEDEVEASSTVKKKDYIDPFKSDTLTEEEINGDFPPLVLPDDGDNASNSDEEEYCPISKANPYLSIDGDEVKSKYMGKLRDLHLKRNEARKLNHQEVSAEDQRLKLPKNFEARKERAEWEIEDKKSKACCTGGR